MRVDEVQPGRRSPVAEQARLDVLGRSGSRSSGLSREDKSGRPTDNSRRASTRRGGAARRRERRRCPHRHPGVSRVGHERRTQLASPLRELRCRRGSSVKSAVADSAASAVIRTSLARHQVQNAWSSRAWTANRYALKIGASERRREHDRPPLTRHSATAGRQKSRCKREARAEPRARALAMRMTTTAPFRSSQSDTRSSCNGVMHVGEGVAGDSGAR